MALDLGYRIRAVLTDNLNLKLVSLAVALFLYSLVHASQEAQRSLLVSVVGLTPSEVELVTPIPAQVRVTVRGSRSLLDDLHADDIPLHLDLRAGSETHVAFDASMIAVPPGLEVVQFDPPGFDLKWEERIVRDIPVEVGIVGTPAPGFVVKGVPLADPATVRARGPKSEVVVIQHVRSDAFDVTGLTEGHYTRQLALDRLLGRVSCDTTSVEATVVVGREVAERSFTKVPVAVIGRANAKAQPADVDVRLACPSDVVRSLRPEQVVPRVQVISPTEHGSDALPVQVTVDQCEVHVTPPSVIVRW